MLHKSTFFFFLLRAHRQGNLLSLYIEYKTHLLFLLLRRSEACSKRENLPGITDRSLNKTDSLYQAKSGQLKRQKKIVFFFYLQENVYSL